MLGCFVSELQRAELGLVKRMVARKKVSINTLGATVIVRNFIRALCIEVPYELVVGVGCAAGGGTREKYWQKLPVTGRCKAGRQSGCPLAALVNQRPPLAESARTGPPQARSGISRVWLRSSLFAERFYAGCFVFFHIEDGVELRDLQQVVHFLGEIEQLEFATLVLGGGEGADEFADA